MSCPYKNIFGAARTGPHSLRIFDAPVVDWVGTFALAYAFSYITHIHFVWSLILMVVLGAILHSLMCVESRLKVLTEF
jgi:hypothetical protein